MSQNDMVIADQNGTAFLADLNSALSALVGQSSGASAPATTYAYMLWADTTNALWKMRNAANTAWITLAPIGNALISTSGGQLTGALNEAPSVGLTAAATTNIGGAASANVNITGTTTITAFDNVAEGIIRYVQWNAATPITYNATSMKLVAAQSRTNAAGDVSIFKSLGTGYWKELLYQPMSLQLTQAQGDARYAAISVPFPNGYFQQTGWQMSAPGSSGTMTITAGAAVDSTNTAFISTASTYTKGTGAWAVGTGNGGIDTGTIAANTWYYWYAIRRTDTGVCDFCFSASGTAPTLPTGYTQYVKIGFMLTDGASTWTGFKQTARDFWYLTPQLVFSNSTSSTTAALAAVLPSGKVLLHLNAGCQFQYYISDPDDADMAPSITASPGSSVGAGSQGEVNVWSNASGQVRYRAGTSSGSQFIVVKGWTDPR